MKVRSERHGHAAILTLDDPTRKNAMSEALAQDFSALVPSLTDARAIILTGAGGAFSGGGDLAMLEALTRVSKAEAEAFMLRFYAHFLCIRDLGIPLIAAVNGAAVGAGLCVALACDMCVVAKDAKLTLNFVRLGLHPGMGATYFAPLRFGHARATELLSSGRFFSGFEMAACGAALIALPKDEVLAHARALAESITTSAPAATHALLQNLRGDERTLRAALLREARAQADSYASAELQEGLAAARAKRSARF